VAGADGGVLFPRASPKLHSIGAIKYGNVLSLKYLQFHFPVVNEK